MRSAIAIAAAAVLALPACKSNQVRISASGSSTVFPITEAMAEEFGKSHPDIRVTVGIAGTGGGFKKFCAGETDLCDASRPITPTEVEQCRAGGVEYLELPVAFDGIAVVVNPKNDWAEEITVAELAKLWAPAAQRTVTRWSQVRAGWPDKEIHLYGPGVDSGTYDYFTEAIVGQEHSSRGDYTASEDDNVLVHGVARDELGLSFFGLAYYSANRSQLRALPVDDGKAENGDGPIAPSVETVRGGSYQPLSRPVFLYVSKGALERSEVRAFVDFYLANAEKLVARAGYVPLPQAAYALAKKRVDGRVTGSVFDGKGSQVGVSVEKFLEPAGSAPADKAAAKADAPPPAAPANAQAVP